MEESQKFSFSGKQERKKREKVPYPLDYKKFNYKPYSGAQNMGKRMDILQRSPPFGTIANTMKRKKQIVRTTNLMDPRYAAQVAKRKGYRLVADDDWDGDGVNDVVLVNKDGEIYSYNGYQIKDSDWIYKRDYYDTYPRDERKNVKYRDYVHNVVQGMNIDFDNEDDFAYIPGNRIKDGWKAIKDGKTGKVKPKQFFVDMIVKPVWNYYYSLEDRKKLKKANYSSFVTDAYKNLILIPLSGFFEEKYELGHPGQRTQQKILANKLVKGKIMEMIHSYFEVKEPLYNYLLSILDEYHEISGIDTESEKVIMNFIEEKFSPPILQDVEVQQIIDEVIAKMESQEVIKATGKSSRTSLHNSFKPDAIEKPNSKSTYSFNDRNNDMWKSGLTQEDLTLDDL